MDAELVPLDDAGTVLAGVDTGTGTAYALKVLPGRPGWWTRRRIEAGLRRMSPLRDVVMVAGLVRAPDGRWALRRELGTQSLPELVTHDGPMSDGDIAALRITLTDALRTVHRAGRTHGAVKPGNVLFRPDGSAVLSDPDVLHTGTPQDDLAGLESVLRFAGETTNRLPSSEPIIEFGPERRPRRTLAVPAAAAIVALLLGFALWPRDDPPRARPAPVTASQPPAGPAVRLTVADPVDDGDTVELRWRGGGPGLTYAVLVRAEGRSPTTEVAGRRTTIRLPVEPGRRYCFTVQGTDARRIVESEPVPIRGATCDP